MKHLFKLGVMLMIAALTACRQQPYYPPPVAVQPMPQQVGFDPGVQMGYQGNSYGAFCTDDRGEQFFMDYLLFTTLMNAGGYNNVVSHYYTYPSDTHIHVYNRGAFRSYVRPGAQVYVNNYTSTYARARQSNVVYHPSTGAISKTISIRKSIPGANYQPVTATPTFRGSAAVSRPVSVRSTNSPMSSPTYTRPTSSAYSKPSVSTPTSRPVTVRTSSSYSAPSRSYSAPSRSYSAPSRSYSAPSRSYSSPSRSIGRH